MLIYVACSANVQCLCVILFDISPQANAILQAIHLNKCLRAHMRKTEIERFQSATCSMRLLFYEVKQSDKLTTKCWWIFSNVNWMRIRMRVHCVVHVTLWAHFTIRIFMALNCVQVEHEYEIYYISYSFAIISSCIIAIAYK